MKNEKYSGYFKQDCFLFRFLAQKTVPFPASAPGTVHPDHQAWPIDEAAEKERLDLLKKRGEILTDLRIDEYVYCLLAAVSLSGALRLGGWGGGGRGSLSGALRLGGGGECEPMTLLKYSSHLLTLT